MLTPETDTLKLGLNQLNKAYGMPMYVKKANIDDFDPEYLDTLDDNVFADKERRAYPCHTKAATWVSLGYFLQDLDTIPEGQREKLLDRFEKRAAYFNMMNDYTDLLEKTIMQEKQAEAQTVSHNTLTDQGGIIENEEDLIKAANWLVSQRNNLPLQRRSPMAAKLIKQADDSHVKLPHREMLEQTAGFGVNEPSEIISSIRTRSTLVKNAEYADALSQLADRLSRFSLSPFDAIWTKVAYAIDDFDKMTGLMAARESGKVPMPEEVVFSIPESTIKEASEDTVELQNGNVYQLSKLATLSREKYADIFGVELADSLFMHNLFDKEAAAEVLPTLPRIDANVFSDMLNEEGIEPATKIKTAGYSLTKTLFPNWN